MMIVGRQIKALVLLCLQTNKHTHTHTIEINTLNKITCIEALNMKIVLLTTKHKRVSSPSHTPC